MIKHDMEGPYQNKVFNAILTDALAKAPMRNGSIDMSAVVKNLCGNYTVEGKKVIKNVRTPIPEEPGTDRG